MESWTNRARACGAPSRFRRGRRVQAYEPVVSGHLMLAQDCDRPRVDRNLSDRRAILPRTLVPGRDDGITQPSQQLHGAPLQMQWSPRPGGPLPRSAEGHIKRQHQHAGASDLTHARSEPRPEIMPLPAIAGEQAGKLLSLVALLLAIELHRCAMRAGHRMLQHLDRLAFGEPDRGP